MTGLRAVELAKHLSLSKGRISQLVGEGRLNGCFSGDGMHRRFDLRKVAEALQVKLDPGQMLGNGADTKKAIRAVLQGDAAPVQPSLDVRPKGEVLSNDDPDQYKLLREAHAKEDLRTKLRNNARDEGLWILASEVDRNVSRLMAQNLAEIETFVKDVSVLVAVRMGIDQRQVRQIILEAWRGFRTERAKSLAAAADDAGLSDIEQAEQI